MLVVNRPLDTLASRVKHARKLRRLNQTELAAAVGETQPTISKIERGEILAPTSIARLARALDVPPMWLELGEDPQPNWTDSHRSSAVAAAEPLAQYMSLHPKMIDLKELSWESIMNDTPLPARFLLAMPDDALAPQTPRGTMLVFNTTLTPRIGIGVLVQDGLGRRFVRMYAESHAGGWQAAARQVGYVDLQSERDQLRVLAVVEFRGDGLV